MLTGLLNLPQEILMNILRFIPPDELDKIFRLNDYSTLTRSYYQNLALYSKYYKSCVVFGDSLLRSLNVEATANNLSLRDLEHLVNNNIYIQPREITFTVCGVLKNEGQLDIDPAVTVQRKLPSCEALLKYSRYFQSLVTKFKVHILVTHNEDQREERSNDQRTPFHLFLRIFSSRLNQLSIEYRFARNQAPLYIPFRPIYDTIENTCVIDKLKLHLFDSTALDTYLQANAYLFCDYLQSLDLSYNNLTDSVLSKITFPPLIRNLNLSNNNISTLCFSLWENLESLNISNNHIEELSPIGASAHFKLKHLHLSCNYLKSNSLATINCFRRLETLDLSRNSIFHLAKMTLPRLKKLNLSGNNLTLLHRHHIPSLVSELDISYCKVSEYHEKYKRRKLKVIVV